MWDTKHVVLVAIATAAALLAWRSYFEDLRDRTQMETSIRSNEQAWKQERMALQLKLDAIDKDKAAAKTPQQIVDKIPDLVTLPLPIQYVAGGSRWSVDSQDFEAGANPSEKQLPNRNANHLESQFVEESASGLPANLTAGAVIPLADLKPLYDTLAGCQECTLTLASANQRIGELTKERDAAVKAAKGGSFWGKLKRNAEWFVGGMVVGIVAGLAAKK